MQGMAALGRGRQAIDYFFELSLFLFVATGFVTAAATNKLDALTVLLVAAALFVRLLSFFGLLRISLSAKAVSRLTAGYFFFYAIDYFLISRAFVDATAHLVFFVLVMKLFSARVNRDYLYLALLAFLQMLLAAIMTIDTSFLGFFLVFLVFGIATFSSYEVRRAYQRAENPAEVPGAPMVRGLGITSALVSVGILMIAGLIFFTLPRVSSGYLSRFAPKTQSISGFSDDVALGQIGQIKKTGTVVMRVRFRFEPPHVQQLRWRGVALTSFDGRRWFNTHKSTVVLAGIPTQMGPTVSAYSDDPSQAGLMDFPLRGKRGDRSAGRWISYTVLLEPVSADDHLFVIPVAEDIIGRFRNLEKDTNDSILLRDRNLAALRYDAWSVLLAPDVEELRKDRARYPREIGGNPTSMYLQLPKLDARIPALAEQVTQAAPSAYDRARLLEEHLRSNYGYTLDLPDMGPDPLAGFLFSAKRGHCEYFASVMAVMLRTLGIPSRVVNGFLPGAYNDISGMYVVRASEAHSWVEAYFPAYGWMTFDPTPAAGQGSAATYRWSMWVDALQTFWIDWVVSYDFSRQFTLARTLNRGSLRASQQAQDFAHGRYQALVKLLKDVRQKVQDDPAMLRLVLVVVFLGAALATGWRPIFGALRARGSRARSASGRASPRDATLAYLRLLDLLARRGYRKSPGMSAREFLPLVRDPLLVPLVTDFTAAYESARFGGSTELVPRLYGLLAEVQRAARAQRRG